MPVKDDDLNPIRPPRRFRTRDLAALIGEDHFAERLEHGWNMLRLSRDEDEDGED